jgi:hypothetical protein
LFRTKSHNESWDTVTFDSDITCERDLDLFGFGSPTKSINIGTDMDTIAKHAHGRTPTPVTKLRRTRAKTAAAGKENIGPITESAMGLKRIIHI